MMTRQPSIKLWLDDVRPAPAGWTQAWTAQEAQRLLLTHDVEEASLDHDLGACEACLAAWDYQQDSMPHCDHVGTGYTLVCWMEETGLWPQTPPAVHSANPVGRARMQQVIALKWRPR